MSYELYLLPVPAGADIEEAGEALLARIQLGHERDAADDAARDRRDDLARQILTEDSVLTAVRESDSGRPRIGFPREGREDGFGITVADRFARVDVPFDHAGEDAAQLFESLFVALAAVRSSSGWELYDPQCARPVSVDPAGRDSTLEVYLSVMDQIHPDAVGVGRRD